MRPYFCNPEHWDKFKQELLSWQGTPYRHFQKAKGYGTDCTLFLGQALVNIGVLKTVSYEYYSKDWNLHTFDPLVERSIMNNFNENLIDKNLRYKKILFSEGNYMRGDCVLISTVQPSLANHCAIMLDDNQRMIHCVNHAGVEITHYVKWWKRHTKCFIRLFEEN